MKAPAKLLTAPRTAKVPAHYVANFAQQLAVMVAAGVPLIRGLETLSFQPEFPHFGVIVECMAQEVSEGEKFSRSMACHPRIFNDSFVAVISIGEETGCLEQSLALLADWIEREDRVQHRMKSAMVYPLSVTAVSALLCALIFTMVLPTFAEIFKETQVPLPMLTQVTLALSALLSKAQFWVVFAVVAALVGRAWGRLWHSPRQARALYSVARYVPGLGSMLHHGSLTRYCLCNYASIRSGVPLTKCLRMAAQASGNPLLEQDSRRLVKCVEAGQPVSVAMTGHPKLYSTTLVQMIQAGEESSQLGEMYLRVGRFHEMEMEASIEMLSAAIEPLLLLGVSAMVGGIVLSVYLPMHSAMMNLAG